MAPVTVQPVCGFRLLTHSAFPAGAVALDVQHPHLCARGGDSALPADRHLRKSEGFTCMVAFQALQPLWTPRALSQT